MVKGIVNAGDAHARSYANSKFGQSVLTLLSAVEKNIEKACDEGKFECVGKFPKSRFPYPEYVLERLVKELEELGYTVSYTPKYRTLTISW